MGHRTRVDILGQKHQAGKMWEASFTCLNQLGMCCRNSVTGGELSWGPSDFPCAAGTKAGVCRVQVQHSHCPHGTGIGEVPCLLWQSLWPLRLSREIPVILSQMFCLLIIFLSIFCFVLVFSCADSRTVFGQKCPVAVVPMG